MNRADAMDAIKSMVEYNKPYCRMRDIPNSVIEEIVWQLSHVHAIYGEGKQSIWRKYILPICKNGIIR